MTRKRIPLLLIFVVLLLPFIASAQDAQVQELTGSISPDAPNAIYTVNAAAGQTLYLYAESSEFDTLLLLCTAPNCVDFTDESLFLFQNDDIDASSGNFNSALQYTFADGGEYYVVVTDCCSFEASGSFRLLAGFDAPAVLDGSAAPTGAVILSAADASAGVAPPVQTGDPITAFEDRPYVQELTGSISPDAPTVWFDIFDIPAGTTLYLYVESSEFDTVLGVCDILCEETYASNDDIDFGAGNVNSALEYTIPADGDYSIFISDCCDTEASGSFRLLIGINAPEVLNGTAQPTGDQIAVLYDPARPPVPEAERIEATDCSELQERPTLSGPTLTRETPNFIIHYTDQGTDGASEFFVNEVEQIMEMVLQVQTQDLGWPLPPGDCGEGGDARFDVYLRDVVGTEEVLGYAQPGGIVVDNPNSEYVEQWAAYGYLVLDNDYEGVAVSDPLALMRATAAHEFHHAIQFGYDINDELNWFYEATSTWFETQTFVEDQDATPYVPDLFVTPDVCVGGANDDTAPLRIYAEWLLIDSIAQDYGADSIQRLWEWVADVEGMPAFYGFAEELNTTPQDIVLRYAIRNLLLDYELSSQFSDRVRVEANINGVGAVVPRQDGVQELGVEYLLITDLRPYTFQIDQPNLSLYVVGIDQPSGTAQVFELGQGGAVDTSIFTHAYVIVFNTDLHDSPAFCTETTWTLTVGDGTGATFAQPLGENFSAAQFIPAG